MGLEAIATATGVRSLSNGITGPAVACKRDAGRVRPRQGVLVGIGRGGFVGAVECIVR